jgi:hypothetical protein
MDDKTTPHVPDLTAGSTLPSSHYPQPASAAPCRHRCTVRAVPPPKRGVQRESWYHYDIVFDGETIVAGSITPEFDACRVLLARGLTGKLDIFDAVTKKLCMTVDIEKGARLTVGETRKAGPAFAKWKPLPDCLRAAP